MSASPPRPPSGPNSVTPNAGPAQVIRKKAPVSIFNPKKRPLKKPPPPPQNPSGAPATQQPPRPATNGVQQPAPPAKYVPQKDIDYQEFPIVVSKTALMEGLHYHAMRLQGRTGANGLGQVEVNPYAEGQFTRPVRLHRRNAGDKIENPDQSDAASGIDDKERELMTARRLERQAEREANQLLIAPTGGDPKRPQKKKQQKKVEDVYYDENDPKQRQRAQLRYEEARPWHLEDFDNKNVWVGSYEEPLSETSVMFEIGSDGFRMVPVEKWYKFTQTNKVVAMDPDAAEKQFAGKKFKAPRWYLGTQQAAEEKAAEEKKKLLKKQERAQARGDPDEKKEEDEEKVKAKEKAKAMKQYQADVDEIDFDLDNEFDNDDEGMLFGDQQEDDQKEIQRKIREEMREANLGGTGVKDEDRDWDEEEAKEKKKEAEERRRAKRIRKQLIKKERKNEYDSDSDRGEFSESSESEDTEEERERLLEEERTKLLEEAAKKTNGASGDKSGASTRGSNTPSGRSEKRDPSNQSKLHAALGLKRPGSPDLSEMSGNESSRKKAKGANGRAMSPNAGGSKKARSLSPDAASSAAGSTSTRKKRPAGSGSGSGSDTDASRTGRSKLKLKASPPGSRAQSPPAAQAATGFPSLEEVKAAIPPEGISNSDLIKLFRARLGARGQEFIALVRMAGKQDGVSKKILPKPGPT